MLKNGEMNVTTVEFNSGHMCQSSTVFVVGYRRFPNFDYKMFRLVVNFQFASTAT